MVKRYKQREVNMTKEELENELYSLISHAEHSVVASDYDTDFVDESEYERDSAYNAGMVYAYKGILKLLNKKND